MPGVGPLPRLATVNDEAEHDGAALGVLIPVKSFDLAKGRLAESLTVTERSGLAERMAAGVIAAASPMPTWVVCNSHDVAAWAMACGAKVIWRSEPGLNQSVTAGVAFLATIGIDRAIIAHGDLPLARDLGWVAAFDGVTIVPDRRGEGTNVMAVPTGAGFVFAYGAGSAPKHRAEAERLSLPVRVVPDPELGWDVDTPDDLDVFAEGNGGMLAAMPNEPTTS